MEHEVAPMAKTLLLYASCSHLDFVIGGSVWAISCYIIDLSCLVYSPCIEYKKAITEERLCQKIK
jgi:hypothetical protein